MKETRKLQVWALPFSSCQVTWMYC